MNFDEIFKNKRVCPMPIPWNNLYELLPNENVNKTAGWKPKLPLILGAWNMSGDVEKKERFVSHLKWAERHGNIEVVLA